MLKISRFSNPRCCCSFPEYLLILCFRFAEDEVSFGINTDDPTLTGTNLSDEYALLRSWGFNDALFARAVSFHSLHPWTRHAAFRQLSYIYFYLRIFSSSLYFTLLSMTVIKRMFSLIAVQKDFKSINRYF